MTKKENKPCSQCGKSYYIQNKNQWLCSECVFKNNHNGLTRSQWYEKRRKIKESRPSGEKELFLEIWRERTHYCHRCGKYLGETPRSFYFSHIKSKGAYPELRLNKDNIELLCQECHSAYEFGDRNVNNVK